MRLAEIGDRLDEHKKDVDSVGIRRYTRSERKTSETELNKSAVTDHVSRNNHVIDWENVKIVDRESDDRTRRIREAIHIRKEQELMNRDEGGHRLSHLYDVLLTTPPGEQHN